jgi:hypothetical protein
LLNIKDPLLLSYIGNHDGLMRLMLTEGSSEKWQIISNSYFDYLSNLVIIGIKINGNYLLRDQKINIPKIQFLKNFEYSINLAGKEIDFINYNQLVLTLGCQINEDYDRSEEAAYAVLNNYLNK